MPAGRWGVGGRRTRRRDAAVPSRRELADLRGGRWQLEGEPGGAGGSVEGGRCAARPTRTRGPVWSALIAPHSGDFIVSLELGFEAVDWGGVSHAGGGSHGSLHAGDSLGPLLFVGCGPAAAEEREQWTLRDVAPVVLATSGVGGEG